MSRADPNRNVRWEMVKNTHGTDCPPYGLLKPTGVIDDVGRIECTRPDTDSDTSVMVNGANTIPAGMSGEATLHPITPVAYDTAETPGANEEWGSQDGSWEIVKGYKGFRITGASDGSTVVATREVSSNDPESMWQTSSSVMLITDSTSNKPHAIIGLRLPQGTWLVTMSSHNGVVDTTYGAAGNANNYDGSGTISTTRSFDTTMRLYQSASLTANTFDSPAKEITSPITRVEMLNFRVLPGTVPNVHTRGIPIASGFGALLVKSIDPTGQNRSSRIILTCFLENKPSTPSCGVNVYGVLTATRVDAKVIEGSAPIVEVYPPGWENKAPVTFFSAYSVTSDSYAAYQDEEIISDTLRLILSGSQKITGEAPPPPPPPPP